MKAITLHQPWATLVACGLKCFETRGWETSYRGSIAIHSGKARSAEGAALYEELRRRRELENLGMAAAASFEDLPFGSVIAVADLAHCYQTEFLTGVGGLVLHAFSHRLSLELKLGDFGPRRFAWLLLNVRPLPAPVEARGFQKLWEWRGAA